MSGLQPDDATHGQDELVLAMLVHGQLHALGDHVAPERGDGARHGFRIEIPEIIGVHMVVVEPEEGHAGDGRSEHDWRVQAISGPRSRLSTQDVRISMVSNELVPTDGCAVAHRLADDILAY
ncbi:hypothetical protein ABIF96_005404 [Bradyrhizobium ottawaense]|uniref:hypothetical protein n=1 Tax=Bradyrhizobium ottawaense TaxID=931866 RepID=UPI0038394B45